jgi:hypothetical protein
VYSGHHSPSNPKYVSVRARATGTVLANAAKSVLNSSASPLTSMWSKEAGGSATS